MSQTLFWLVAGCLLAFLVAAWAFYVRKLGGFIEYINRPFPSLIVLGAAAVAGFLAYFAAIAVQGIPSQAEVDSAPSRGGDSGIDKRPYEESYGVVRDDEEEKAPVGTSGYNPITDGAKNRGQVDMRWRENKQVYRDNALRRAKQIGLLAAVFVAALGYVVLMLVTAQASRRVGIAVAMRPPAGAFTEGDLAFEEGAAPREPSAAAAFAPDLTPDTVAAEPSDESQEGPINLDDLEKSYRQYKQDNEGKAIR